MQTQPNPLYLRISRDRLEALRVKRASDAFSYECSNDPLYWRDLAPQAQRDANALQEAVRIFDQLLGEASEAPTAAAE